MITAAGEGKSLPFVSRRPLFRAPSVIPGFGLTFGLTLTWLCLIVLIPLSAVFIKTAGMGWDHFVSVALSERALAAYRLSFGAPLGAAFINAVFGLMMFDPKCGPGDSGGCAMGLLTVPVALALPSFALFTLVNLIGNLWRLRPRDPAAVIRKLRNWGRED